MPHQEMVIQNRGFIGLNAGENFLKGSDTLFPAVVMIAPNMVMGAFENQEIGGKVIMVFRFWKYTEETGIAGLFKLRCQSLWHTENRFSADSSYGVEGKRMKDEGGRVKTEKTNSMTKEFINHEGQ
ncbi:MAG: hypothetical protein AB7S77_22055 [Desulfatirhabdiaceae bacterium]